MRNTQLVLSLGVLVLTLALGAPLIADEEVRRFEERFFAGNAQKVHLALTIGDLTVEGTQGGNVEVEAVFECSRENLAKCRQRAERVQLVAKVTGPELTVKLKRTPRGRAHGIRARLKVRVPRHLPLELDVRGGGVYVSKMASDLEIDAISGDVDVVFPHRRARKIEVDVGVGSADLYLPESRVEGTGFPRSLTWHGDGNADLNIDVGTGDVTVRLE